MTKQGVLSELEALMLLAPGSLDGSQVLAELEAWDSMLVLDFIALADEHFGLTLAPRAVAEAGTVDGLLGLLGISVEA